MTQEELFDWVSILMDIIGMIAAFALICAIVGFAITKMDKIPAKKTVPDCGSCRLYKDKSK
jgi:hypothetical protein